MTLDELVATCGSRPDDEDAHHDLARRAIAEGAEDRAGDLIRQFISRHPDDARGWQWLALLLRGADQRREAIAAMTRARELAPHDPSIAQGLARLHLEAGLPSVAAHLDAIRLKPGDTSIRLGLASARLADGDGAAAQAELGALLTANPGWIEGHRQYGQLAAQVGAENPLASVDTALERFPDSAALHEMAIAALAMGERHDEALARAELAIKRFSAVPPFSWARAVALDELQQGKAAAAAFDSLGPASTGAQAVFRIRHLLRCGELQQAGDEIDRWLGRDERHLIWPYAHLVWRATGDRRAAWLEREGELVAEVDLGMTPAELDETTTILRGLHRRAGRFLDQSVRFGSQTDGPLLARIDPPISRLRERLREAVGDYIARLPPPRPDHPLLGLRRDRRPRFCGSWSVRLTDRGFHASHHHPEGWISSAFYLVVPSGAATGSGVLEIGGSPPGLGLDLAPLRRIEPVAGRLALFPSTMWHSTAPFSTGERLTVAFDVARP